MDNMPTGKAREGKYCPRCQTMTLRHQDVCGHCGHRFRTGMAEDDLNAPIPDEAALHRTRQFTLPPLPPRGASLQAGTSPDALLAKPGRTRLRWTTIAAASAALLLMLIAGLLYFRRLEAARIAAPSPVGIWETAPAGHSGENARLRFDFQADGSGRFSWSADSVPPIAGQAALHWQAAPDGKLALAIAPPTAPDSFAGPFITAFNSRPWLWQVDRARQRLLIGALAFHSK